MWCPDCKTDFETVPGSEVQVCPTCRVAAKQGKRRRRVPKLDPKMKKGHRTSKASKSSAAAEKKLADALQSPAMSPLASKHLAIKSTPPRPAELSTQPKVRVDDPHREHGIRPAPQDREWLTQAGEWLQKKSLIHVVMFGLLIFLLGQALLVWAFLVGHYAAWSVANLVSVAGFALAIIAIAATLRNLDERVERLSQLVGRQQSVRKSRKSERKSLRKK